MDVEKLARSVNDALGQAHTAIRKELRTQPYGLVTSAYGKPGLWETAEAIGILRWEESDRELLTAGVAALLGVQAKDGGYAPWPDLSSGASYCESTTRVLLSIAPVFALDLEYDELKIAVRNAASWIFRNEDREGGWGSLQGLTPRLFPTCFAIQALAAARRAGAGVKNQRCGQAIARGARWIEEIRNDDGGYGTRAGEESNHGSSCHAAWGLTVANVEVPSELREYVLDGLDTELPATIEDPVDDPAREAAGGRFDVSILSAPTALVGAVSVRADIYERRITTLVERLLETQHEGIWRSPSDRFVWSTYMHVAALRLWLAVHRSYAGSSTSDFRELRPGSLRPSDPERTPILDNIGDLRRNAEAGLEDLSDREKQAFVAYVKGEPYKVTAEKLGLSHRTVESYRRAALQKLGIPKGDRYLAGAVAARGGLVPNHDEVLAEHAQQAPAPP